MDINGEVMRSARKKKRLSIKKLAAQLNMSYAQVSHIQNGKSGTSKKHAKEMAKILGVTFKALTRAYVQ